MLTFDESRAVHTNIMPSTVDVKCLVLRWEPTVSKQYGLTTLTHEFPFRDANWWLEYFDGNGSIYLYLDRRTGSSHSNVIDEPFDVSTRVEDSNRRVVHELDERKKVCRRGICIWHRRIEDVQRVLPSFRSICSPIAFIVTIEESDNWKGMITKDTQTVRESSDVQSTLPASTIPCLESLSVDLTKLLDEEVDADVEFHCDGLSTKAHRTVVSARSPVLAKMLKNDMVEGRTGIVKIQDMEAATFRQFLRYLYSGELEELIFQTAIPLYEAADQYEVRTLASRCSEFITRNLSAENAYDALIVADTHSDSKFVEEAIDYMVKNKFPLSNDRWSSFCEDQPRLAHKVVNRFCQKSKWTGWED